MRSEPTRLDVIPPDFAGTPPKQDENFHMNIRKWASPAIWDRVFFNQFCFLQMLIK